MFLSLAFYGRYLSGCFWKWWKFPLKIQPGINLSKQCAQHLLRSFSKEQSTIWTLVCLSSSFPFDMQPRTIANSDKTTTLPKVIRSIHLQPGHRPGSQWRNVSERFFDGSTLWQTDAPSGQGQSKPVDCIISPSPMHLCNPNNDLAGENFTRRGVVVYRREHWVRWLQWY